MSDILTVLLSVLKFASTVVTGAFGILALLVDYKDHESGKLTHWGRIAVIGVIISSTIAIGAQAVESYRAKLDASASAQLAADNLQRAQRTLEMTERLLQPIGTLDVYVEWGFPGTSSFPVVNQYASSVALFAPHILNDPAFADKVNTSIANGELVSFDITPALPIHPWHRPELATLLLTTGADVSVFADGASAAAALKSIKNAPLLPQFLGFYSRKGDLAFEVGINKETRLRYLLKENVFSILLHDFVDEKSMRKTGNVVSIPDLAHSSVLFMPSFGSFAGTPSKQVLDYDEARKHLVPLDIVIAANGHEYRFRKRDIRATYTTAGVPVFEIGPLSKGELK